MNDAILVALITGACAVVSQVIISAKSTRELYAKLDKQSEINDQKLEAKLEKYQAVTDQKIEELTREVRKHNNFAEKIPVIEEKISVANNRIKDLETAVAK